MNTQAPLPRVVDQKSNWQNTSDLARGWQLNQLATKARQLGARSDKNF
jgi:hypothetical protein